MPENYFNFFPDAKRFNDAIFLALNDVYVKELMAKTPVSSKSHTAASTSGSWAVDNPSLMVFEIVNPQGAVVNVLEYGAKEHIIKAKNKKFLKFKAPKGRKTPFKHIDGNVAFKSKGFIYAKMVRHPEFHGLMFVHNILEDESLFKKFQIEVWRHLE